MIWNDIRREITLEHSEQRKLEDDFCGHLKERLVRYKMTDDRISIRRQCVVCDEVFGAALKKSAVIGDIEALPLVTCDERENIYLKRAKQRRELFENEKSEIDNAFWEFYHAHLNSDLWREIRRRVINRAKGVCEGCGILFKDGDLIHIHHMTYDHLGDEFLFELVAICAHCHQKIHPHREIEFSDIPF